MRVSTQFPIAVHALLMIAYFPNIRVTSEMVAESVGNNSVVIRNIYGKLKQASILSVQRGAGNTKLQRPANEITLLDVYIEVETDDVSEVFKFPETLSGVYPIGSSIRELLFIHLKDAMASLKNSLNKITIEELQLKIVAHINDKADFPSIVA